MHLSEKTHTIKADFKKIVMIITLQKIDQLLINRMTNDVVFLKLCIPSPSGQMFLPNI